MHSWATPFAVAAAIVCPAWPGLFEIPSSMGTTVVRRSWAPLSATRCTITARGSWQSG